MYKLCEKTGWKVGEEQKVKKVKESREEEKDREKEHMQGPRRGSLSFKPSASGKF